MSRFQRERDAREIHKPLKMKSMAEIGFRREVRGREIHRSFHGEGEKKLSLPTKLNSKHHLPNNPLPPVLRIKSLNLLGKD